MRPLEIALWCWLIGLGTACILQFAMPRRVATGSVWGSATGWQREVAAWNLGLCIAIIQALVLRDETCQVLLGQTIVVLAVALGANHAVAARHRLKFTHTVGILSNIVGIALIGWGLLMSK